MMGVGVEARGMRGTRRSVGWYAPMGGHERNDRAQQRKIIARHWARGVIVWGYRNCPAMEIDMTYRAVILFTSDSDISNMDVTFQATNIEQAQHVVKTIADQLGVEIDHVALLETRD